MRTGQLAAALVLSSACANLGGLSGGDGDAGTASDVTARHDARDAPMGTGPGSDAQHRDAPGSRPDSGNDSGHDAETSAPPSCAESGVGLTDCPDAEGGKESCCASLEVATGSFDRTYTNTGGGATGEAAAATVSGFRLDRYDVTVARFRQFVNAWNDGAGYTPPEGSGKHTHLNGGKGLANAAAPGTYEPGWLTSDNANLAPTNANLACDPKYATWTPEPGSQENLPMDCESWWEAYAFCIWDGGFLPSEAEWEYAAAGGSEQLEYPWGTTAPGTANAYAIYGCNYPGGDGDAGACSGVQYIAPVGTALLGAGRWGQVDLVGNVWQWTLDWYATSYLDPCDDCANTSIATDRTIRGAAFSFAASYLVPPHRNDNKPSYRADIGIRCARVP